MVSLLDQKLEWIGIGKILSGHLLKVPPFQRSYAWGKAEFEDFWDDLSSAAQANEEYFLGPIVVTAPDPNDQRLTIIDGQQRIATATILLAALRDKLVQMADTATALDIRREFIGSEDLRTRNLTPKLLLNEEDRAYFTTVLLQRGDGSTSERYVSHKKIAAALDYFKDRVAETIGGEAGARDKVIDWVDYIRDSAIVMFAQIPAGADAYAIFESLNARGKDLALADLLKNHLFSTAGQTYFEDVRRNWTIGMNRVTETAPADEAATKNSLRHYWNSYKPLVREKDLYKSLRREIKNASDATSFARSLEDTSEHYSALLTPGHLRWQELGTKTAQAVENLLSFGLEQNRPLLLAAMSHLEDKDLSALLKWLVAWSVRGLVVGGIGKGKTEATYAKAALAISEKKAKSVRAVFRELEAIIPTDADFGLAFRTYSPPTNKRTAYLLRALESGQAAQQEPYLVPNPDRQELTVEHVLPLKPNLPDWPGFGKEDVAAFADRLGNLVLIPGRSNRALGNKPFKHKVQVYKDADFVLTRSVAQDFTSWTPEAVNQRQDKLAKLALTVWPREP